MSNVPIRIQELARKWAAGTISSEERTEFLEWYGSADDGQPLHIPKEFATDELMHSLRIYKNIYEKIKESKEKTQPVATRRPAVNMWIRYAAAVILVLAAGAYFFLIKPSEKNKIVKTNPPAVPTDVKPPGTAHAVITLADGTNIILDSLANGAIAIQGNVQLTKLSDGQILYKGRTDEIAYNTLSNPRGSKVIQITLSDGTRVWLNSESSIRYPTAFTGPERLVEVTGETYFEVAKNPMMPFHVKKGAMQATVLGTHFNVNAYEEEDKIKVTLLEGSVDVSSGHTARIRLSPGDQSQLNKNEQLSLMREVDTEEVMAWKNGKFDFGEKTDIGTIMRQLARWYNLELEYHGNISQHFGGSIPRDVNLSKVLKVLEATGRINFKVEGTKVTVMP